MKEKVLKQRTKNKLHVLFLYRIHHFMQKPFSSATVETVTDELKLNGFALQILIPANQLSIGREVALKLKYNMFQSNSKRMIRDEGEKQAIIFANNLKEMVSPGITFDTFITYKPLVELVSYITI